MKARSAFAEKVFLVAGIYGLVVLLPQYFMEETLGHNFPPPLTHPENFYGFIGIALAWQFAFLLIARDVQRFRLFMLPAVLEKLSFGIAALVLYGQGRIPPLVAGAGGIDLLFAASFALAFRSTSRVEASWRRDSELFNFRPANKDQNTMKVRI
jgi:hypothetical protein